jgi:hypothetical protein
MRSVLSRTTARDQCPCDTDENDFCPRNDASYAIDDDMFNDYLSIDLLDIPRWCDSVESSKQVEKNMETLRPDR